MVFIPQMLTQDNSTENVTEPYSVRSQSKSHLPFGAKASQVIAFQLRMIESRTLSTASRGDFYSSEVGERVQAKWEVPGYFTTITECRFKAIQIVIPELHANLVQGAFVLALFHVYLFISFLSPLWWSPVRQLSEACMPRVCALQKKKKMQPPEWEALALQIESSSHFLQLEKAHVQ